VSNHSNELFYKLLIHFFHGIILSHSQEYPAQTKASEENEIHYSPTAPLVVAGTAVPVAVESPIIVSLPPAGPGHAPPVVVMGTTVAPPTATPVPMLTPPPGPQVYAGTLPPVPFKISRYVLWRILYSFEFKKLSNIHHFILLT
jgi:hypothetical protein